MPETLDLSKDQLIDFIKSETRNFLMEDVGEQIEENLEKRWADWEKMNGAERAKTEQAAFKSLLFGSPTKRLDVDGLRNKRFAGKADDLAFTGEGAAGMLLCLAKAKTEGISPVEAAKAAGRHGIVKALEASDASAGGTLIPEDYSLDFIGYLYNKSVVRMMGANIIEMPNGNLNLGRQNATATHYWVGEGGSITVSQLGTDSLILNAKKGAVLVPISNDLIEQAPAGAEALIRQDMTKVAVIGEDSAFIRGVGSQNKPKGIYNWLAAGQIFDAANADPTVAQATSDLLKAMYKVDVANHDVLRPGWMMNPRVKYALMKLRTDDGFPVFMQELMAGTLMGAPVGDTNNIPKNLSNGGNDDNTEIYYGDFAEALIGETTDIRIDEAPAASYVDGSGNTVHGFQTDQTVLRLIHRCDFALRHNTAFAVIENCRWGSSFDA